MFNPPNGSRRVALVIWVFLVFMFDTGWTEASGPEPECDIHHGPCSQTIGETEVSLEITPRPVTAMRVLHFRVVIGGRPPSQVPFVSLDMPGMPMGPNVVKLKASSAHTYEGRGLIVRCVSRRTDWRATVHMPGIGVVRFYFDVARDSGS